MDSPAVGIKNWWIFDKQSSLLPAFSGKKLPTPISWHTTIRHPQFAGWQMHDPKKMVATATATATTTTTTTTTTTWTRCIEKPRNSLHQSYDLIPSLRWSFSPRWCADGSTSCPFLTLNAAVAKAEQRTVTLVTTNSWRFICSYLFYSLFASIIHLATWQLKQLACTTNFHHWNDRHQTIINNIYIYILFWTYTCMFPRLKFPCGKKTNKNLRHFLLLRKVPLYLCVWFFFWKNRGRGWESQKFPVEKKG